MHIDTQCEDAKIKIIGNDDYNLEDAFELLAGTRETKGAEDPSSLDVTLNCEITARSLLHFLEKTLAQNELTLDDCETFLYCMQKPLRFQQFKEFVSPLSNDFVEILE